MKHLFISCPHGFEQILSKELSFLGIAKISERFCGVLVPQTLENVFTINYLSRVATRVLWPLAEFRCHGKEDLYAFSRKICWDRFMQCHQTFAIDSNVQHPTLKNSLFASFVVKDAICDYFREKTGARPSVNTKFPHLQLNLFIQKGFATLYLDTSGAPLHKRGWKEANTEATLHESLAASLLLLTGYTKDHILCDPFCGSGTFLVEAGLIATETPPGFLRKKWGFFSLPDFEISYWQKWKQEKEKKRTPLSRDKIFGSDKSRETAELCSKHVQKAGLSPSIFVDYQEIAYYEPKVSPNFIITNPPYGKRLETSVAIFEKLREFIQKFAAPSVQTYVLCPEEDLLQKAGLTAHKMLTFKNGGLPVTLFSIENIY
jgi:putative N6-adenine-specific DNA methylase